MDGALAELKPLQTHLDAGPSAARSDKFIDTIGDKVDAITNSAKQAMTVIDNVVPVMNAFEQTDLAQKIERAITHFADDIPWLMKGLDELARIHPAVTVAVLAFKAVYALETTRRENDRRVMTLYVEMKDMMIVMIQLKGVENRTHVGLDGRVLKDRLEELAEKTAQDIKDCANVCDTFLKKRLIVKVLKGPVWADKLAGFVKTFTDRKADFQFALVMHSANTVTDVKRQNQEIDAKIDVVIALFDRFLTSEERCLAEEVENKGGTIRVRHNDEHLKSLLALDIEMHRDAKKKGGPSDGTVVRASDVTQETTVLLDDLKWELREDINVALNRNLETFLGKFELHVSALQVALESYIREENDRIIGAVKDVITQGPHMKIRDPELRKIWQDMNWRGNVKARLLVMTLRDHYRDVIEDARHSSERDKIINDEWTLEYLGPTWFQPIFEAFDDDASGYVTIAEMNKFMGLRPLQLKWSLPRWLAYWAIGWGVGAAMYTTRIKEVMGKIRLTLPHVLPLNRSAVDEYLRNTWTQTLKLILGIRSETSWILEGRFQDYLELEEQRIRSHLELIRYHIDAPETISLVLGPGRLEKSILPLLLLLLQHDYRKIQAARQIVLAESELRASRETMDRVFTAIKDRYSDLTNLFRDQKLELDTAFEKYACGLFYYRHFEDRFWSVDQLKSGRFMLNAFYDEEDTDVVGFEEETNTSPGFDVYAATDEENAGDEALQESTPVQAILGLWNGFIYSDHLYPARPMLSLRFCQSSAEDRGIMASGVDYSGDTYHASGVCGVDENCYTVVEWSIKYSGDLIIHYTGRLSDDRTIEGRRGQSKSSSDDEEFILKKIPAEYMCLRPSPAILRTVRDSAVHPAVAVRSVVDALFA
ncbi:hypothetical protein C8Q73DRAFT_747277 [Cubamyces lactineus]|nr:hypothetical protein C8Q73DRAFT_747277 [Cubamyces lactineus]